MGSNDAIPGWAREYIGLTFKDRGRGPDGLDCWGLVRKIYKERFRITLPSYIDSYKNSTDGEMIGNLVRQEREKDTYWLPVNLSFERLGDVIALRMKGEPMHAGLILSQYTFIHIHRDIGSVVQKYTSPMWEKRVVGIYRHVRMINAKQGNW